MICSADASDEDLEDSVDEWPSQENAIDIAANGCSSEQRGAEGRHVPKMTSYGQQRLSSKVAFTSD